MKQNERIVIASVLLVIAGMVGFDLFTDSKEGVFVGHLFIEGAIALMALLGVFYVLRGTVELKHKLEQNVTEFIDFKRDAELWRAESRKYLDGLSNAIDLQLSKWSLSAAEKEVAFLLLKGMSLKEIAAIRNTAEKTARVQSMAIYSKSGLSGRSELSAFFLEDLLVPPSENQSKNQ